MRLVACHIENFGKLRALDYTFQPGVNVIYQENGWGKTTFAAFIKAMFYGMPSSTKRSVLENERKKYMPWQGGGYGGNLTFAQGEAVYRIERFFGEKDKEDTFALYNQKTGLLSDDYTAMLGEELFGINMEGYERSACIPQLGLNITANDSINAKLSHLLEDGNDINHYETALASLEEAMKVYKKTGNRGRLAELEIQLAGISRELERSEGLEETLPVLETRLKAKRTELDALNSRQQELKRKVVSASHYDAQKAKQEHYAQLCEDKKRIEESRRALRDFFRGQEPTEEELLEKMKAQDSLGELSAQITAEKEKQDFYEKEYQKAGEAVRDHTRLIGYVMGGAALIFWGTAIVAVFRLMSVALGISAAAAGMIAFMLFVFLLRRSSAIRKSADRKKQDLSAQYHMVKDNMKHMQELRQAHEEEVSGLLRFYFGDMRRAEARDCIDELRNRKRALKNADDEYTRICDAVTAFEQQNHILEQTEEREGSEEPVHETLQELQRQEEEVGQKIDMNKKEIRELTEKTERMGAMLEERSEQENEQERLTAELEQKRERYEILGDTAKYLKKAKEALSTHYFGDLQDSFNQYIRLLCSSLSGAANMDIRFQVKVEEGGAKRELDFYSEGYKDMIGICTRLALIDVLFSEERPFIVFDDPFASFDEAKLQGMLQMLQKLGEKYQIIYFVCHRSRA